MKKVLCRVVLNLGATPIAGRFNIKYQTFPILREGAKTVVIKLNNGQENLVRKETIRAIVSDFDNDKSSSMQYYTVCYQEDLEVCIDELTNHLVNQIRYIHRCHVKAIQALNHLQINKEN